MIDEIVFNARAAYETLFPINLATTIEAPEYSVHTPIGTVRCRPRRRVSASGLTWAEQFWLDDEPVTAETLRIRFAQKASSGDPVLTWMRYRLIAGTSSEQRPTTTDLFKDMNGWAGAMSIEGWTVPSINVFSARIQECGVVIKRSAYGSTARNVILLPKPTKDQTEAMRLKIRSGE